MKKLKALTQMITGNSNKELYSRLYSLTNACRKEIKKLNYGGCGVFAYYLSRQLTELQIEHQIIILSYFKITRKQQALINYHKVTDAAIKACNDISFSHIMIRIKNKYYDGYTFKATKEHNKVFYWASPTAQNQITFRTTISQEILKHCLTTAQWSSEYSTNQTRKLSRLITKHLKRTQ